MENLYKSKYLKYKRKYLSYQSKLNEIDLDKSKITQNKPLHVFTQPIKKKILFNKQIQMI